MQTKVLGCALLTFLATLFFGCVPLGHKCYEGRFAGLSARVRQAAKTNAAVHIVMIHGMTDHCPGYGETFASNVAARLNLVRSAGDQITNLPLPEANATNVLRNFSYSLGPTQVFVHELTWTPTTYGLKTNAFAEDRRLNARRLWLNKMLKSEVIDEGFGDAVLYLNPSFQTNMQKPIRQTIDYVVKNSGEDDRIVLVASSLGSKMTFDTVERWASDAASDFAERTTDIIMLANQVPLINLGTRTITNGQFAVTDGSLKSFLMRSQRRKVLKVQQQKTPALLPTDAPVTTTNVLHVVAATDPNDLLSFPVRGHDVPPPAEANGTRLEIQIANIYSHNAWGFLCLAENPSPAHTAYDVNEWLLDRLVRGFWSTNECLPKAEPLTPPCPGDSKEKRPPGKRF